MAVSIFQNSHRRLNLHNITKSVFWIDLFRLYILFSHYRSCDDTQEIWSFVLFIKKSACKHGYSLFLLNEHSDPRILFQVFAKNSQIKNIFEEEKTFDSRTWFFLEKKSPTTIPATKQSKTA